MSQSQSGPDDQTSAANVSRSRFALSSIFWGRNRLRAGWGVILYIILVIAIISFIELLFGSAVALPRDQQSVMALPLIRARLADVFSVTFAAVLMAFIERRRFSDYGFKGSERLRDLATGFGWGIVTLSLLVGVIAATGGLTIEGPTLSAGEALVSGGLWVLAFLLVAVYEEFAYRGYLQFTLARGLGAIVHRMSPSAQRPNVIGWFIAALLLSAGFFTAGHLGNTGETALGLFGVAVAGLVFAYSLWRTGALWWAIGAHTGWNWAQSYIYGVGNSGIYITGHLLTSRAVGSPLISGGSVGPEGSIFLLPIMILMLAIIHYTLPKRRPV